ncbi:hypothetical protein CMUS01_12307 [Colletotrichum musicola]|uniref:2EXR domain-containing protein n=1 Tax=Colletotrichum musicola TaxID=2175873 RepID=A0A8H6JNZ7_9PEZI|nr:hypothetical protein CMUS01_12307 [Colletotrichum musicola]
MFLWMLAGGNGEGTSSNNDDLIKADWTPSDYVSQLAADMPVKCKMAFKSRIPVKSKLRAKVKMPFKSRIPFKSGIPATSKVLVEVRMLVKPKRTPTFPFFPSLPPELRQRVWELSPLEPRTVVISDIPTRLAAARTQPSLRQTSQGRYYTKYFASGAADGRYDWINLDVDTIHITQYSLRTVAKELPLVRNLVVEGFETVTMLHRAHFHEPYDDEIDPPWWHGWFSLMEEFQECPNPISFRLKVVYPESEYPPNEYHQGNYYELEMDRQRQEISDTEDVSEDDIQQADSELEDSNPGNPGNYDVKPTDSEDYEGPEAYNEADAATQSKSHIRKWLREGVTVVGWVLLLDVTSKSHDEIIGLDPTLMYSMFQ